MSRFTFLAKQNCIKLMEAPIHPFTKQLTPYGPLCLQICSTYIYIPTRIKKLQETHSYVQFWG